MEDLKELVLDYREFITNVLITEDELYSIFLDQLCESTRNYLFENNRVKENVEQMILENILYDFVFFQQSIKKDMLNATEFFEEEYSKKETLEIYKKIKKVFKDFYVEELESEV